VWAQEHLVTAGYKTAVDGDFGPATQAAVQSFQTAKGLASTGIVDQTTWYYLLRYKPAFVHWWLHVPKQDKPKPKTTKTKAPRARAAADSAPVIDAQVPRSASLPQVRNELAGAAH
jgi:peptidoglycan hydrolase-like protein with peptidoglycan-binding domain